VLSLASTCKPAAEQCSSSSSTTTTTTFAMLVCCLPAVQDVPRTYPSYRQFATEAGRDSLRRVLRAYAYFDIEVGYCQVGG
jgi:hypothetical protein